MIICHLHRMKGVTFPRLGSLANGSVRHGLVRGCTQGERTSALRFFDNESGGRTCWLVETRASEKLCTVQATPSGLTNSGLANGARRFFPVDGGAYILR